jgi:hypothetical protein
MTRAATKRSRAGHTDKISVSIDRKDLDALRRRARRLHGGNLSAVIAEGVRRVREEEGREALVAWLGEAGSATEDERNAVRSEWVARSAQRRSARKGR